MRCQNCGVEVDDCDKYCKFCGNKITINTDNKIDTADIYSFDEFKLEEPEKLKTAESFTTDKSNKARVNNTCTSTNLGIIALILSLAIPFVSMVLGIVGLFQYQNEVKNNKSTSDNGKILCILGLVFSFVTTAISFLVHLYFEIGK